MSNVIEKATDLFSDIGHEFENAFHSVEKIGQNIIDNPLPVIETIALTAVGVPYPVAAAAVTAANGGSIQNIAISAAAAYAGGQIGEYVGNSITGALPEGGYGLSPSDVANVASTVQKIVTSSSGPAFATAARGGNFQEILNSGLAGGVSGLVASQLSSVGIKSNEIDGRLITNAVNNATNAILNGKDVTSAITNSTVGTLASAGLTDLAGRVSDQYGKLSEDSSTLQSINNSFSFGIFFKTDDISLLSKFITTYL